jgi:hypothetical protein
MGLLDDLKRQADMVRTHDSLQRSNVQDNIRVVEEAMHRTFLYLNDLFKQLDVLRPANPIVYHVEGAGGALRNLKYAGSSVDPRKKRFMDREVYDYMDFHVKWAGAESLVVERDMPVVIQKLKQLLWTANIKFTMLETKSAHGSVMKVQFTIPPAFATDFTLKADIEGRRLLFYGKNTEHLGLDDFAVPADQMSEQAVEELAKMLLGQRSEFTRFRAKLPRP